MHLTQDDIRLIKHWGEHYKQTYRVPSIYDERLLSKMASMIDKCMHYDNGVPVDVNEYQCQDCGELYTYRKES